MIGQLSGVILDKQLPWIWLDVHGVGYEVQVPMSTGLELGNIGDSIVLFTHFVVREDAQLLYGFHTKSLKEVFRQLIKLNGVGPKVALAVLSGLDEFGLKRCIDQKDVHMLSQLPGIGKKTAERLVIELQDKLDHLVGVGVIKATTKLGARSISEQGAVVDELEAENLSAYRDPIHDAVSALVSLGYKSQEAQKWVEKAVVQYRQKNQDQNQNQMDLGVEALTSEFLIKNVLKSLMR